jgi:hypothetical protein
MQGIIIGILAIAVVLLFVLWRNAVKDKREARKWWKYYEKERNDLDFEVRNVGTLLENNWEPVKTHCGLLDLWTFQASDEQEPRRFQDAVTRQRKLDEIAKYNLPKEYEVMDDSKITT